MRIDLAPNADGVPCLECIAPGKRRPARGVAFVRESPFVRPKHDIAAVLWLCDECAAQLAADLLRAFNAVRR